VWRVRVKRVLGHHAAARLIQYNHMDPSPLVFLSGFQDLASYTNIKFLSYGFTVLIEIILLHEND
jgi:hypothetical protein